MENKTTECENCENNNIWKADYCFTVQNKKGEWVTLDKTYFITAYNAQHARIKSQNRFLNETSETCSDVHEYLKQPRIVITKDTSRKSESGSISLCPISLEKLLEITNKKAS